MTKQPSVSVVIPAYNEQAYIEECVQRVAAQDYPLLEILLIDNNSTDETLKRVKDLKIENLQILHQTKQQGVVATRQYGFKKAKGDIIATLDADSMAEPEWITNLVEVLTASKADAVSGYCSTYEGGWRRFGAAIANFFAFPLNRIISGHPMIFGSNYAVVRQRWDRVKDQLSTREDIWEDLDTALIFAKNGYLVVTIKKKLIGVSIRILEATPSQLNDRLKQWTRTYQPHNKRAAILSVPIRYSLWTLTMIFRPLALAKYQPRS